MKKLVIKGNSTSTKEIEVPDDFESLFLEEYTGKEGDETLSKTYLIKVDNVACIPANGIAVVKVS